MVTYIGERGIQAVAPRNARCGYTEGVMACTQDGTRAFKAKSVRIEGYHSPLDYVTAYACVCSHHDSTPIVTELLERRLAPWFSPLNPDA